MGFGIISLEQILGLQLPRHKFCCFRNIMINSYFNTPINNGTLCRKLYCNKHIKTCSEIGAVFNQSMLNNVLIICAAIYFLLKKKGYFIKRIEQVNYIGSNWIISPQVTSAFT